MYIFEIRHFRCLQIIISIYISVTSYCFHDELKKYNFDLVSWAGICSFPEDLLSGFTLTRLSLGIYSMFVFDLNNSN